MTLNIDDLNQETIENLGIKRPPPIDQVAVSLIALGRVFSAIKGLPDEEALRVLHKAQQYILKRVFPEIEDTKPEPYVPPMGWTIQVVAKAFYLDEDDLKQRSRRLDIAQARNVAMWILTMFNKWSYREIGEELGNRTPATVYHAFQSVAIKIDSDTHLRTKITEIYKILTG